MVGGDFWLGCKECGFVCGVEFGGFCLGREVEEIIEFIGDVFVLEVVVFFVELLI